MLPPSSSAMDLQMDRPSPVPWCAGLVVKKGLNSCVRCSGAMPEPVSSTSITTRSPAPRVSRTRTVCLLGSPAGMACAALTSRLSSSWPSRASLPRTSGTLSYSRTSRARWRMCRLAIFSVASSVARTSTGRCTSSSARAKVRTSRTSRRMRSAPSRVSLTTPCSRCSCSVSTALAPSESACAVARFISRVRYSRLVST
jgi:hypothetical protein